MFYTCVQISIRRCTSSLVIMAGIDQAAKEGVTVVLGGQWGDEGKGKLVDILAQDADIVARCQVSA